jgi:hypothetical protein
MKRICSYLLSATILLAACKNNKPKEVTIPTGDGDGKVTIDVNQAGKNAEEIQKRTEDLGKLTPLTTDQLKALLPETLMGTKRSDYNVANAMGYGMATAKYKINDSTNIELSINDCAGTAGAGFYTMSIGMYNFEQDNDREYTKTISYGDGKAYEHCEKARVDCSLTWFAGDRYMVILRGDNVNADGLKAAGKELKF